MNQRKKFLSLLLVCVMVLPLLTACGEPKRVTKETEETTYGIDVARYQGTINWQEVAQSGVDFAMVRVGYRGMEDGLLTEDSNGRYNLQEASKAGIALGAYFFSTAISEEEAEAEARWVAEILDQYPITYPVAYDCEGFGDADSRQFGISKKARTDAALKFLETIEELGYEGMFYASKLDMEEERNWDISRIESDYKIWVAQYPAEPYPITPESSYSGTHQMWQYTMEGSVNGIAQNVDMNIAYFGYDGIEPAKSDTPPEEVGPDIEAMMSFEPVNEEVTAEDETNLRDIPSQGSDSQVLYTLKNGQVAQRIAVSSSGWSKVIYEGNTYYAVSSYLMTMSGEDGDAYMSSDSDEIQTQFRETNQIVTAKDVVNLRSLPSVEHPKVEVLAQLKNGDTATCIGTSDSGWSKLIYKGTTCYAISSYLTPASQITQSAQAEELDVDLAFAEVNEVVTAKDKVNLRNVPNTDDKLSDVIGKLYHGDTASRVGISSNGWSKLVYQGITCYAVTSYLEKYDGSSAASTEVETEFEEVDELVTAKKEVNLRTLPSTEDPNCVVVVTLKNGEYVTRTGINRPLGWSRVVYEGRTLYCVSNYLTTD